MTRSRIRTLWERYQALPEGDPARPAAREAWRAAMRAPRTEEPVPVPFEGGGRRSPEAGSFADPAAWQDRLDY